MRLLALDIGTRRTGIAYLDTDVGIPLPLDTVEHQTQEELIEDVMKMYHDRKIDRVIVGLPKLLSGKEGSQSEISRCVGALLEKQGVTVTYADERYSTPRKAGHKHALPDRFIDGDASAACAILSQNIRC